MADALNAMQLLEQALSGRIDRRAFMARAAALGLSAPVLASWIWTPRVQAAPQAQTPKPGGKAVCLTPDDPKTLDIHVDQLAQLRVMAENIYDSLTYIDASDMVVKPRLAKEWAWADPTTLQLTLESGVTFHDGQPFTAEDVKFSLDRVKDPATASLNATVLEPVESIEIVDDTHLTFKLKYPWPALLEGLAVIYIYARTATFDSIREKPNGTGPFRFVEWKPDDYLRIEKNPSYWQEGLPYLDTIDYKPVAETDTRIALMETGEADVMFNLPLKDISRVESNPNLTVQPDVIHDVGDILYINNSRAPLNNQELRLMVSYALDRATFFKAFLGGHGSKNTSPWSAQHWAYNPINDTAFPYDLEQARQHLEAAGYPGGKDASGKQLTINIIFPNGYPEWEQGSVMLQSALKELGVEAKVEKLELATWADRLLKTGDFDLSWDFIPNRALDPTTTTNFAYFYKQGPQNICRYQDQELADLTQRGATTLDQEERKPIYYRYQERWNEIMPGIIVGERVQTHLTQAYVRGFVTHPQFWQDMRRVWLDK